MCLVHGNHMVHHDRYLTATCAVEAYLQPWQSSLRVLYLYQTAACVFLESVNLETVDAKEQHDPCNLAYNLP